MLHRAEKPAQKMCAVCGSLMIVYWSKQHNVKAGGYWKHRCENCLYQRRIAHNPSYSLDKYRKNMPRHLTHVRATKRLRIFGVPKETYWAMVQQQHNQCAICGEEESSLNSKGEIRELCVDHNHETGQVRALLCHKCNAAIGMFGEDIERMKRAIAYLDFYKFVCDA